MVSRRGVQSDGIGRWDGDARGIRDHRLVEAHLGRLRADNRAPRADVRTAPYKSPHSGWRCPCGDTARARALNWRRSASTTLGMSGYCSLHATSVPSGRVARCTWPETGGGGGFLAEAGCIWIANPAPSSACMRRRTKDPAHGRGIGLQFREFGRVFGGQRVRHRGQELRDLHQRPFQARPEWLSDPRHAPHLIGL